MAKIQTVLSVTGAPGLGKLEGKVMWIEHDREGIRGKEVRFGAPAFEADMMCPNISTHCTR